jgi:TetR/AcrR family transcriptional repressor of nem operon
VRIARLEQALPPKAAVKAFIDEVVERSVNDPERRGCMLINAAAEFGPRDREFAQEIAARLDELQGFFRRVITRARADGSLARDRDPAELSRLMLGVVVAIRVLARVRPERALLKGIAKPALALLD